MEVQATIASVRGLVQALQAIRTSLKLPCAVTFDASGLKLRFLDGGHTMQSGISLSAAVRMRRLPLGPAACRRLPAACCAERHSHHCRAMHPPPLLSIPPAPARCSRNCRHPRR